MILRSKFLKVEFRCVQAHLEWEHFFPTISLLISCPMKNREGFSVCGQRALFVGADGKVKDRSLLAHSISSFVLKTNSRRILNPDAIAQPRPSRRAKNRLTVAEKKKKIVTGKSPEAQLLLIKVPPTAIFSNRIKSFRPNLWVVCATFRLKCTVWMQNCSSDFCFILKMYEEKTNLHLCNQHYLMQSCQSKRSPF